MNKPEEPAKPGEAKKPSYVEVALADFIASNPWSAVSVEKSVITVDKPWGADDIRLRYQTDDAQGLRDLNNVVLNPRFDAIFHSDEKCIEFIFGFLAPNDELAREYIDRKFLVHFEGANYLCSFEKPSERLYRIAKNSERIPADPSGMRVVHQLVPFRDVQNLDKLPGAAKEWFARRIPRSFFVRPEGGAPIDDVAKVARHINFLSRYYDRAAPQIVVRDPERQASPDQRPLRLLEAGFPKTLAIQQVDEIVLRLLEVARESPPRFAFVYHYQVLEYVGYYYLDEKIRRALRSFLKDPAVINCGDEHIAELIAIFGDTAHNDDAKMRRVIEEHCDPRVIWKEVDHHKAFFATEQTFEGGFVLPSLIASDTTLSTWVSMWMPKTFDVMTKVRNALVHAREKRENKVILPTGANNRKVRVLMPVMQRIAEQLALKTS